MHPLQSGTAASVISAKYVCLLGLKLQNKIKFGFENSAKFRTLDEFTAWNAVFVRN